MRIRYYGLLANRHKHDLLARARQVLGASEPELPTEKTTAEWLLLLLGVDSGSARRRLTAPPLRVLH